MFFKRTSTQISDMGLCCFRSSYCMFDVSCHCFVHVMLCADVTATVPLETHAKPLFVQSYICKRNH